MPFFKYFKSRLFPYAGGPPPCPPRRSAGGRPIGQEISKIRGGNMKQNPLKSRGLWGVREWNRKKMYPSGWKHYAWVKKTLRRTFVSLWKNCFSPFGRKNNHFFLGKQKFASEFFCPWHKVSTQKEHIFYGLFSPFVSQMNLYAATPWARGTNNVKKPQNQMCESYRKLDLRIL